MVRATCRLSTRPLSTCFAAAEPPSLHTSSISFFTTHISTSQLPVTSFGFIFTATHLHCYLHHYTLPLCSALQVTCLISTTVRVLHDHNSHHRHHIYSATLSYLLRPPWSSSLFLSALRHPPSFTYSNLSLIARAHTCVCMCVGAGVRACAGASLGDRSRLLEHTLIYSGEFVDPATTWQGYAVPHHIPVTEGVATIE